MPAYSDAREKAQQEPRQKETTTTTTATTGSTAAKRKRREGCGGNHSEATGPHPRQPVLPAHVQEAGRVRHRYHGPGGRQDSLFKGKKANRLWLVKF